jgi:hypothetical protein
MSITIRDETANELVLTIDNSGNMYFGNGTPINALTMYGSGIIDDNGVITYGVGTQALNFVAGTSFVDWVGNPDHNPSSVTISTLSGHVPTVEVDSDFPSATAQIFENEVQTTTLYRPVVVVSNVLVGSFTAGNTSHGQAAGSGHGEADPGTSGNFSYRWI